MNEKDDEMRQEAEQAKQKMEAEAEKKGKSQEDEDTGAHLSPERDIGSQRNATSSSRTPSNEM
jgi:hypothetical protein